MQIGSIWNNSMSLINKLDNLKEDTSLHVGQNNETEINLSDEDSVTLSDKAIKLNNEFENSLNGPANIMFAEMDGSGNEPP